MKRINALIAILICNLFVMAGCSQEQTKSAVKEQVINQTDNQKNGPIKDDLTRYSTAVKEATSSGLKIDKLHEDLKSAKSAKVYVSILRERFVPLVSGIVTQMEAIKPATKEVQDIHGAYKASLKDYLSGLQSMADAVEKNNSKLIDESALKINALTAAQAKFSADINALSARTNSATTQ